MVGITHCAVLSGVEGLLLTVEADASEGFPQFEMVGLLSSEVKEARERVRTAISNSGYELPVEPVGIPTGRLPEPLRPEPAGGMHGNGEHHDRRVEGTD